MAIEPKCDQCDDLIVSSSFVRPVRCVRCQKYVLVCYECLPKGFIPQTLCSTCVGPEEE